MSARPARDPSAHDRIATGRLPRTIFVCIGNAGRSQMAQAFYERLGGEARSAGSRPEAELHPEVVEAMREVGIDLRGRRPGAIALEDAEWAEVVVAMGCGDACPVLPGKRYLDWNLPDPAGVPIEEVRRLRDEIERRVAELALQARARA
jgi:arsenate reductase